MSEQSSSESSSASQTDSWSQAERGDLGTDTAVRDADDSPRSGDQGGEPDGRHQEGRTGSVRQRRGSSGSNNASGTGTTGCSSSKPSCGKRGSCRKPCSSNSTWPTRDSK